MSKRTRLPADWDFHLLALAWLLFSAWIWYGVLQA